MPLPNGLPSNDELASMSEAEVRSQIDKFLGAQPADWRMMLVQIYRDELARRQQDSANATMLALTRQMRTMTGVILLLTIVNVVLFAWPS